MFALHFVFKSTTCARTHIVRMVMKHFLFRKTPQCVSTGVKLLCDKMQIRPTYSIHFSISPEEEKVKQKKEGKSHSTRFAVLYEFSLKWYKKSVCLLLIMCLKFLLHYTNSPRPFFSVKTQKDCYIGKCELFMSQVLIMQQLGLCMRHLNGH